STARETAREIGADGGQAHAVVCDVTKADDVARLAAEAATLAGEVDLLVNNAGIGAAGEVGVADLNSWPRAIDANPCGVNPARLALRAVERGKLYALPHGEIRWLWRVKRAAPRTYARLVGALERRGVFSRA